MLIRSSFAENTIRKHKAILNVSPMDDRTTTYGSDSSRIYQHLHALGKSLGTITTAVAAIKWLLKSCNSGKIPEHKRYTIGYLSEGRKRERFRLERCGELTKC